MSWLDFRSYYGIDPIGCYVGSHSRIITNIVKDNRPIKDWTDTDLPLYMVELCRSQVEAAGGYDLFAIEFWGNCWAANSSFVDINSGTISNNCVAGMGGEAAQFIYKLHH